jgi:hypothetical protein
MVMNFIEALESVPEGKKIRRANGYWNYTYIAKLTYWGADYLGWFEVGKETRGYQWNPKVNDLLAEDWEVLVD